MRAMLCALCATAILSATAPAGAQEINLMGPPSKMKTQDEVDAQAARDKAYQNTMKKLSDQNNAKRDPWGNIRSGGADAEQKTKKKAGAQ
jgi:hypothetical protein